MKNELYTLIAICIFQSAVFDLSAQEKDTLSDFALDYNVPQSPGLFIVGESPTNVISGSKANPLAINFVSGLLETGKLQPGLAIDLAPYTLLGGTFDRATYIRNPKGINLVRAAINSQISLATVQSTMNTNNLVLGAGYRTTLFDSRDIVMNDQAYNSINNVLGVGSDFDASGTDWTGDGAPKQSTQKVAGLLEAVSKAKETMSKEPGTAMSVGYAYKAVLSSGALSSDSLSNEVHRTFASWMFYRKGYNVIVSYNGTYWHNTAPKNFVGISIGNSGATGVSGEVLYDFSNDLFIGGLAGTIKVTKGVYLIASIYANESQNAAGKPISKITLNSALRYNIGK